MKIYEYIMYLVVGVVNDYEILYNVFLFWCLLEFE